MSSTVSPRHAAAAPAAPAPPSGYRPPTADPLRRRRERQFAVGAALLLAASLFLRAASLHGSFFLGDDFVFMGRAVDLGLTPQYLFTVHGGHLMPLGMLGVWLITTAAPLSYGPAAVWIFLMQVAADLLLLRLLVLLFGRRPAILVPFALYVASPLTLPSFIWLAAAVNALPMQAMCFLVVDSHVRYLTTGRRRWLGLAVGALVVGLLSFEKTILVVPFVAVLTAWFFVPGSGGDSLRSAFLVRWRLWVAYLAPSAAWLVLYLSLSSGMVGGSPPFRDALNTVYLAAGRALIPAMSGGPWAWNPLGLGSLAHPPLLAMHLSWLVAAAVVWGTIRLRHQAAARAWLIVLGWFAVDAAILLWARASLVGPLIGLEYRYIADMCVPLVVCLGLAALPLRPALRPARGALEPSVFARLLVYRGTGSVLVPTAAAALAAVMLVGALTTTVVYNNRFHRNPSRAWFSTVASEIDASVEPPRLIDGGVPEVWTFGGFAGPVYSRTSGLLHLLRHQPVWVTQASDGLMISDQGHIVTATLDPAIQGKPGPVRGCGWFATGPAGVRVPLAARSFPWQWWVRLSYFTNRDSTPTLSAGTTVRTVQLQRGPHALWVRVNGVVDSVAITELPKTAGVCVTGLAVGLAKPSQ